jgi:hypothetical protein
MCGSDVGKAVPKAEAMVKTPSVRPASSETSPVCLERRRVSLPAARLANQGVGWGEKGKNDPSSIPCWWKMVAYDPEVLYDEERLCVGGEERHPLPRAPLLLILGMYP